LAPVSIVEEVEEDCEEEVDKPDAPLAERTGLVDLEEEARAPGALDDKAETPAELDMLDRCDPAIPLVEEAESVVTEVVALFEAVLPEVEVGLGAVPVDDEEFWR
jgi:hypothetical protein